MQGSIRSAFATKEVIMSKQMRAKYAEDICSKEYIKTGKPKYEKNRETLDQAHITILLERNRKNTEKAIAKTSKPKKRRRRTKEEYKIVFE